MWSLVVTAALALPPVIPVSEIKAGMKGECLTVFEGDVIEPFAFVVKGVMQNFLGPHEDVVLVKLQGEKAEFTGVVAGMSGSPCSIDGKLVGALAYSFTTFAKEPIAGITPMKSMLGVMHLPEESRPWRLGREADGRREEWTALREGAAPPRLAVLDKSGLRPIATPLSLGGVAPSVFEHFEPTLRAWGFEPMAAGTAGKGAAKKALRPGSAVAAVLVRGDVDIAATGTVTSVDGDQVLAFGHPFFGAGAVSIPMANAEIINTMASSQRSFKMAVTGAVVGEVTQDRLTAIGGFLNREAAMLKVAGSIKTVRGAEPFELEVARDQALSPRFVALGIANSLTGRTDVGERGTVRFVATLEVAGHKAVTVRNVYSSERDATLLVSPAIDIAQAFELLWDTPFGPPPKISVQLDATVTPEPIEEWVEAIHLDRPQARPGELVDVAVRLRRKGGGQSLERFRVPIPHEWAGEGIELLAGGAEQAERTAHTLDGDLRPDNLDDVVQWLRERRADGRLYLLATRGGAGVRSRVEVLPFLPPSVVATLSGGPSMQRRTRGLAWEEWRERPGVVSGTAAVSLSVVAAGQK